MTPHTILLQADDVLRRRWVHFPRGEARLVELVVIVMAFSAFYGAVMGTFGGVRSDQALQVLYSAVKVPMLLTITFGLSLPFFYVINALLGLAGDFRKSVAALVATQAAVSVLLASLAPLTAFWYATSADYLAAITTNGVMFGVASLGAQRVLAKHYRPLVLANPRHRWALRVWFGVYAFVAIQLAWILRPFVGDPNAEVQFFRDEAFGNAYLVVLRVVWTALTQ
jgi:hypothetical protein